MCVCVCVRVRKKSSYLSTFPFQAGVSHLRVFTGGNFKQGSDLQNVTKTDKHTEARTGQVRVLKGFFLKVSGFELKNPRNIKEVSAEHPKCVRDNTLGM